MKGKHVALAGLISVLLTLVIAPTSTQQGVREYDPWADMNDDGKIDIWDIAYVAKKFGTQGDNITKASIDYNSGWVDITDKAGQYITLTHNLNSTDIMVDIQGKTTLNGGVHQRNLGLMEYAPGWSKTHGEGQYASVVQTSDGGYVLAGVTVSPATISMDFWLVRTDSAGNMQWNVTYGGTEPDLAFSVVQTSDGGYAVAGGTLSFGRNAWLIKTDSAGGTVWNRTYGGANSDNARSLVQTGDGGYALAGYTSSYGAGGGDFWLVKTDSVGNVQWNQTYGGTDGDYAYSLVQTSDGGYAIAGETWSFGSGSIDGWLVKTDAAGVMQWNQTYGGSIGDETLSVVQTLDGGYALAGLTSSFGAGALDFWLVKTDAAGNAQWNHTYGGANDDEGASVIQTSDGGYAIAGKTRSYGAGSYDSWLVKTDASGNMEWSKTYGGTDGDYVHSLVQTSDGAYALAGGKGAGLTPMLGWLVKSDVESGVESGLAWTDSTADTIILYRGATDPWWNFVRVRVWKIKENP